MVLMLVYIDTASAVKVMPCRGTFNASIIALNANESLKNVGIDCAIGWSITSTYLPIGLVMLAQSEHTGLVDSVHSILASAITCHQMDWWILWIVDICSLLSKSSKE